MAGRKIVIITGEPMLAEEYGILLHTKGFAVRIRSGNDNPRHTFPKGLTRTAKLPRGAAFGFELTNTSAAEKRSNLALLERALPTSAPLLSSSVTFSLSEQATWMGNPARLVGIGALPTLLSQPLVELAVSFATKKPAIDAVTTLFESLGKETALVRDSVGMVLPRILCSLANEACFAMGEGVAQGGDIDTAMKLGTNYPKGPVEWAEQVGPLQVFEVMASLQRAFGEDRYRPAPFLAAAARKGTFRAG